MCISRPGMVLRIIWRVRNIIWRFIRRCWNDGRYDETVPGWLKGKNVLEVDGVVNEHLTKNRDCCLPRTRLCIAIRIAGGARRRWYSARQSSGLSAWIGNCPLLARACGIWRWSGAKRCKVDTGVGTETHRRECLNRGRTGA